MPNYYDYVERILEAGISQSNRKMVDGLSLERLCEFHDAYLRGYEALRDAFDRHRKDAGFPDALTAAPTPYDRHALRDGEFRPLLLGDVHSGADIFGGDSSVVFDSVDGWKRLDALKKYLLYSHRIILPDPLFYINKFFYRQDAEAFVSESRGRLASYLDFLFAIRELVREEIVSFYPNYEFGMIAAHNFASRDFIAWADPQTDSPRERLRFQVAHADLIQALWFCQRFGGSFMIDREAHENTLEKLFEWPHALAASGIAAANDRIKREDRRALQRLASIDLPGLDRLPLADVVAVRRQSEGFGRWREFLKEGLLRVEAKAADDAVRRAAVRDSIASGRTALETEIGKSSLLASVRNRGTEFGIGAVAGLVATGDPAASLLTGTASSALKVLWDFFQGRGARDGKRALMKHYVVWTEPSSAVD